MNILVTGSAGFVGMNLVENLKNIRDGKNRTRPNITIEKIYEYDRENTLEELDAFCADCNFVFNLAGVNRPKDTKEFKEGNFGFASTLLNTLKKHKNTCPVMLSSSLQATLAGRFGTSEYGLSKKAGEELFFAYAEETGATVYVYRFPNLVGKWVRPNYNSAVGTFCNNIANDLPITVNDPAVELEMLFIDDLLEEMYDALEGKPHRCVYPKAGEEIICADWNGVYYSVQTEGRFNKYLELTEQGAEIKSVEFDGLTPLWCEDGKYCGAPVTHKATLGRIVELLNELRKDPAFENLSVGIISFYSKQVERISEEASKYGYTEREGDGSYRIAPAYQLTKDGREKLRIGSVDSFQGKEFDIVILSTVRSNNILRIDENNLRVFGFLTLENRLNVAFSRAQKMLITVGDAEMFNDDFADTYVHGLHDFYTKLTVGDYGRRI